MRAMFNRWRLRPPPRPARRGAGVVEPLEGRVLLSCPPMDGWRVAAEAAPAQGVSQQAPAGEWEFSMPPPQDVLAVGLCDEQVNVSFVDIGFWESGFELERADTAAGPFARVATAPSHLLSGTPRAVISDRGDTPGYPLVLGRTYYYRMRATGAPNNSAYTAPASVTLAEGGGDLTFGGSAKMAPGADGDIATLDDNQLQLTDNVNGQTGTLFFTNARDVEDFRTTFVFQILEGNGAEGFAFVIQRNRSDGEVVGAGGIGLGYVGMPNSLAVEFDFYQSGTGGGGGGARATYSTGVYVNGSSFVADDTASTGSVETGFVLDNGNRYEVDLVYNSTTHTLTQTITNLDDLAAAPFEWEWSTATLPDNSQAELDIRTLIGGDCAFVGFTAATSGLNADQRILNWTFNGQHPGPPPPCPPPPDVEAVYARGTTWAGMDNNAANVTFKEYLEARGLGHEAFGYRLSPGATSDILPWVNMNEVVLPYSGPIPAWRIPAPESIMIDGVRSDYRVVSVTPLDGQTLVLQLDRPLGSQPGGGENGDRIRMTIPGAGAAGGNYTIDFNVLQGDVNKSGAVVAADFSDVKHRFFRTASTPGPAGPSQYSAFHDVDGSGSIIANDFSEVKKRFFDSLPPLTAAASGDVASVFSTRRVRPERRSHLAGLLA